MQDSENQACDDWRSEFAQISQAGLRPRYPWENWLNGSPHDLVAGLDFVGSASSMRTKALDHARKRGLRVRTRVARDVLTVKVLQPAAASAEADHAAD